MSVRATFAHSAKILQRYEQTSEKHEVYFNVFHSECSISSRFTSKIEIFFVKYKQHSIRFTSGQASLQKKCEQKTPPLVIFPIEKLYKYFKDR